MDLITFKGKKMDKQNLFLFLILQLFIVMFVCILYKVDQLPERTADCTLEINKDVIE
jgi:hypothetical protein